MRILGAILLVTAGAFAPALTAQEHRSDTGAAAEQVADLAPAEVRRLDHYAEKAFDELAALAEAEKARDAEGQTMHGEAVQTSAERYMFSAIKAGLGAERADGYFQALMAESYDDDLPRALAEIEGQPTIQQLLAGLHISGPVTNDSKETYVDSVREFGKETFEH